MAIMTRGARCFTGHRFGLADVIAAPICGHPLHLNACMFEFMQAALQSDACLTHSLRSGAWDYRDANTKGD